LKTGAAYDELAERYRIGISTVHNVIKQTLTALCEVLAPEVLKWPTEDDYYRIMEGFLRNCNMPNCVGAIDGKHINIQAPPHSNSAYYNYKGFFSVVLMAWVDSQYRFIAVDIGQYGGVSDSSVFCESEMGSKVLGKTAGMKIENLYIILTRSHFNLVLHIMC
jgi:hypothetical protein